MRFGNPVKGRIYQSPGLADGKPRWFLSQPFGKTSFTWEPPYGPYKHFNRGADIARGPQGCGDPALAMQSGTVLYAGPIITPGDGGDHSKVVIIAHGGGHVTGIAHLQSIDAEQGRKVARGDRIGAVGRTGVATGCHEDVVYKTSFPSGLTGVAAADAFYRDPGKGGKGQFGDIWPNLMQNAPTTVRLRGLDEIQLRNEPSTGAKSYAQTRVGLIRRNSDNAVLGPSGQERKWGGTAGGGEWTVVVNGKALSGDTWEKVWLNDRYRFVASALAILSE